MTKKTNQFDNYSNEQLIDALGRQKAVVAETKAKHDLLADELKTRFDGNGESEGKLFRCTVVTAKRTILDTTDIREKMGEEWCWDFEKTVESVTLRITARTAKKTLDLSAELAM